MKALRHARFCVFALTSLLSLGFSLEARPITITSTEGVSVEVELIELKTSPEYDEVRFRRVSDRREFRLSLDRLIPEDRKRIRKWWTTQERLASLLQPENELDLRFKYNETRREIGNSNYSDEDEYRYEPQVEIVNDDFYRDFKDNQILIVCFAKHTYYKGTLEVVSVSNKTFDIPKNKTIRVTGETFSFTNYDSDHSSYEYGWERAGYAIIIRNAEGEITHTKASESFYLDHISKLMAMKEGEYYGDRYLDKKDSYYR